MPTEPQHVILLDITGSAQALRYRSACSCGEHDPISHNKAGLAHGWGDRHLALAQEVPAR